MTAMALKMQARTSGKRHSGGSDRGRLHYDDLRDRERLEAGDARLLQHPEGSEAQDGAL